MKSFSTNLPVIMAFSGNDPCGGAGIQADIETLASMGCHCSPIVTTITAQDTNTVKDCMTCPPDFVIQQARVVLEDIPIAAFKIGLIGSAENVQAINSILHDYPNIPVILDPIISSGDGTELTSQSILDAIITLLLPKTTVCLPNTFEAKTMAPEADTLDACAHQIMAHGTDYVLITGTHNQTGPVINTLYTNFRKLESFKWPRLKGTYHGSGCTLAASTAGLIAQGLDPFSAVHEAQEYTWETLKAGYRIGMGQYIPNRIFWAKKEAETFQDSKAKEEIKTKKEIETSQTPFAVTNEKKEA